MLIQESKVARNMFTDTKKWAPLFLFQESDDMLLWDGKGSGTNFPSYPV
jgi:hypothetical protein